MGQRLLKKHSKFQYFIEARLGSGTRFYVSTCQYTRTILRNENVGQSLFKKYSKSQKFDEFYTVE